ncbi:MAG: hypothetical protein L3J41_10785 [Melioribacteraceae bacterium]|nr:hypothetical protein [Melioribacteraceae bacterium]
MNNETISKILRVILSGVFIFSAISKLIAPGLFEITILNQGIIETREVAAYFGRFIIAIELFLGVALLQSNYLKKIIIPATLLTLIVFTVLLFFPLLSGDSSNCGCFGEVIKMSPLEAIIKNIVSIIVGVIVFLLEKRKPNKLYIPTIILLTSFAIVFFVAPIKSYENLTFSKYTNFENEGVVDLTDGDKLVAVFFIDCEHCMETANDIVTLENETSKFSNFYMLFAGEETDSIKYFLNKTNINYPYLRIPIDDFFDLIGSSPPRIYWLQNGDVKEYWDDDFSENLIRYKTH